MTNESNTSNSQHIWCSATITQKMEDVLIGYICDQTQKSAPEVSEYIIYLSTPGGNPFCAVNLFNFIKALPQKTKVYNMGSVASAGVPFFLGFKERIGVPDCSFMIHQTTIAKDFLPHIVSVLDIDKQKANLLATDRKTQKIIHTETGTKMSLKQIRKACENITTYTAQEALKYGFIEKIEMPNLPEKGILYITDQSLATLPG